MITTVDDLYQLISLSGISWENERDLRWLYRWCNAHFFSDVSESERYNAAENVRYAISRLRRAGLIESVYLGVNSQWEFVPMFLRHCTHTYMRNGNHFSCDICGFSYRNVIQ